MNSQSNIIKMIRCCVVVVLLVVSFPTRSLIQQVSAQTILTPITITWSSKAGNQGTKSVTVGGTVKWLWGDNFRHDVVSSNPNFVNSSIKTGSESFYEFNFTKAGSYPYHCSVHATTMVGTIEVLGATVTASAVPSFKPSSSSPSLRNSASPQFTATTSVVPSIKPSSSPSQTISASPQFGAIPSVVPSLKPSSSSPSQKITASPQFTATTSVVPSIKPSSSSPSQKITASPQFTATTSVVPSFKPSSSSSPSQKKSAKSNKPTIKPSLRSTQSTVTASAVPSIKPSLSSAPQKKSASSSKIPSKVKSNPQANDAPVKAAQPLKGSKTTVSN